MAVLYKREILWEVSMVKVVKSYEVKVDSKKRITLRNTDYEYFYVKEFQDWRILLEPRELAASAQLSKNTLEMMDEAIENYKKGRVSKDLNRL